MDIVQGAIPFAINYVDAFQADDLFVAALVYDVTTGTPVFEERVDMVHTAYGSYVGTFEGVAGHTYLTIAAVYTDGTFTTADTNYAPASNEVQCLLGSVSFFAFDYTDYDQSGSLFIRASIFDVTDGTPELIDTVVMEHVALGCYFGSFEGEVGSAYETSKMVFTDGTYTTPATDRAAGSDSFQGFATGDVIVSNVFRAATLKGQSNAAILRAQQ